MPSVTGYETPNGASNSLWGLTGASYAVALATNDGDTSFISHGGDGTNRTDREQLLTVQWTGLPTGCTPQKIGIILTRRQTPSTGGFVLVTGPGGSSSIVTLGGTSYADATEVELPITASPIGGTTYQATIGIYPGSGLVSGQSALVTQLRARLTYNQLPSAPTLTSPADGATVGSLLPTFTGNRVDADGDPMTGVELEVRRVSDNALMWASGNLSASGSTFSKSYAGSSLTNGIAYKWRARTYEVSGVGAWSAFRTFTPQTNSPPTVTAVSPIGGATIGTLTPTLSWSYSDPEGQAQSAHQVQVRRKSDTISMWDPGQVASAAASVAYAGTTLVGGTAYEWRVRVQDSGGAWSDYTAWQTFTPAAQPNPPTSIAPTGLQGTLTPTISGTYNQGSGATEAAYQYEIRQGATTIYQSGDVAADLATGQAYGTDNPSDTPSSPPALAWGTSYEIRVRSKDSNGAYSEWSAWQPFATNAAPTTPTNLAPSGAVTGDTTPTLSWTHNDPDGDAQTAVEIELRLVSDDSAVTGYDPKALTQSAASHDVTETLTASPATQYKWRVRTKGLAGPGFGPWSNYATFTVASAPTVTVIEPSPSDVIAAPALAVEWSMSGGSGTQQSYRVRIYASDQVTLVHDSGSQSGTATTYTLPAGVLKNNGSYYVQVEAIDTLAQTSQSTKVLFSTSWTPPGTITGLNAVAVGSQS